VIAAANVFAMVVNFTIVVVVCVVVAMIVATARTKKTKKKIKKMTIKNQTQRYQWDQHNHNHNHNHNQFYTSKTPIKTRIRTYRHRGLLTKLNTNLNHNINKVMSPNKANQVAPHNKLTLLNLVNLGNLTITPLHQVITPLKIKFTPLLRLNLNIHSQVNHNSNRCMRLDHNILDKHHRDLIINLNKDMTLTNSINNPNNSTNNHSINNNPQCTNRLRLSKLFLRQFVFFFRCFFSRLIPFNQSYY
jgi:type III secretory pathway component EscV